VQNLSNIIAIEEGGDGNDGHSLALRSDGTVWAWGANRLGQIGDGTTENRVTPVQVQNLSGAVAIAIRRMQGISESIALRDDGTVWTWGGSREDGNVTTPLQVQGISGVIAVSAGERNIIALKSDGTVWAWGENNHGQLGNDTATFTREPLQVQHLNNIVSISAGREHNSALRNDGTVWTWGKNSQGQLGNGTTIPTAILEPYFCFDTNTPRTNITVTPPVQVQGLSNIVAVSAGNYITAALRNDGTIWTWGENHFMGMGRLGDGTTENRRTPVQVVGANGAGHFNLLTSGGTIPNPMISAPPQTPPNAVNVIINGIAQNFEVPPQIIGGRTMLPLRAIGEALGMEVGYDNETRTVTLTADGLFVTHVVGTTQITVSGENQNSDVPSALISGRVFLPLRVLAEAIGANVEWDAPARTAIISQP
jgi:hypothetical protein